MISFFHIINYKMYNMSTQQIPLCTTVMDENEISKYGLSIDRSVKDII